MPKPKSNTFTSKGTTQQKKAPEKVEKNQRGSTLKRNKKEEEQEDTSQNYDIRRKRLKKGTKKYESDSQSEEDEDDQERKNIKQLIDDVASEDSKQEQSQVDSEAQINHEEQKKYYEKIYKVKEARETDKFLHKFQGKKQQQIQNYYDQKVIIDRQNRKKHIDYTYCNRKPQDNLLFELRCTKGMEEDLAINILNKASHAQHDPDRFYFTISAVYANRKIHKGKIFVEAPNQTQVKKSLFGLRQIVLSKNSIKRVPEDIENLLFQSRVQAKCPFKVGQFIKILEGTYEGDLGQIVRFTKKGVVLQVVPRLDLVQISSKLKAIEDRDLDEKLISTEKNILFKNLTDPRRTYKQKTKRPQKRPLQQNVFAAFSELPTVRKLTITKDRLLLISLTLKDIQRPKGQVIQSDIIGFNTNQQNLLQFLNKQAVNIKVGLDLRYGSKVEIILGQLRGYKGTVVQYDEVSLTMKITAPKIEGIEGLQIEQIIDHVQKYFDIGQKVQVIRGVHKGVLGHVTSKQEGNVSIATLDNKKITVHSRLVQHPDFTLNDRSQISHQYRSDDIIKYNQGSIAYVLSVSCNYLEILTTDNKQIYISAFQVDNKISQKYNSCLNTIGQKVQRDSQVKMKQGILAQSILQVRRVYQKYVFLKSTNIIINHGMVADYVDNCFVIQVSDRDQKQKQRKVEREMMNNADDEYKRGRKFTIPIGYLKGYQGIITKVMPAYIEVSIATKNIVEVIQRSDLDRYKLNRDRSRNDESRGSEFMRKGLVRVLQEH